MRTHLFALLLLPLAACTTSQQIQPMPLQAMTVNQLERYLDKRYSELPGRMKVDVLLKSTAGKEVYVLGEVGQTGAYTMRRPIWVPVV
jgi:polysaccharide export outer membrane protein